MRMKFVASHLKQLKKIKMLAMDVDGVLTDCRIYLDSEGDWRRMFSIRDGVGIKRLIEHGYQTAFITGSKAKDIQARAKVLGIHHLYEGSMDKEPAFQNLIETTGLKPEEICYVGDDFFDVPLLKLVGFAATVPEAMEEALKAVDYVTKRPGGNGAIREICDLIFKYGAFSSKKGK